MDNQFPDMEVVEITGTTTIQDEVVEATTPTLKKRIMRNPKVRVHLLQQ